MELHRNEADKFERTADRLSQVLRQIDPDDPDPNAVNLAIAEAKRVRRASTILVKTLAVIRDKLQP